jgi:hypothetical protein
LCWLETAGQSAHCMPHVPFTPRATFVC